MGTRSERLRRNIDGPHRNHLHLSSLTKSLCPNLDAAPLAVFLSMLAYNACIRKVRRTVVADVVNACAIFNSHQRYRLIIASHQGPHPCARRTLASSAEDVGPAPTPDVQALMPLFTNHKRDAIAARMLFDERSLQQELIYLRDPLKLANHITQLLQKGGFDKAVELVRMASKNVECTVSWNHLVNHEMGHGKPVSALKLYHEVSPTPSAHGGSMN